MKRLGNTTTIFDCCRVLLIAHCLVTSFCSSEAKQESSRELTSGMIGSQLRTRQPRAASCCIVRDLDRGQRYLSLQEEKNLIQSGISSQILLALVRDCDPPLRACEDFFMAGLSNASWQKASQKSPTIFPYSVGLGSSQRFVPRPILVDRNRNCHPADGPFQGAQPAATGPLA